MLGIIISPVSASFTEEEVASEAALDRWRGCGRVVFEREREQKQGEVSAGKGIRCGREE